MCTQANQSPIVPTPEIINQLNAHMYQVAILRAALELEVWAKVASGKDSADKITAIEHWDPLGTRILLDDLSTLKLLTKEGNRYRLTPEAEHYLVPGKPTYLGKYLLRDFFWEGNGKLAEAIRTGNRPIVCNATTTDAIDNWIAEYSRSWSYPEEYLKRCDDMWRALGIQGKDGLRVLDLACGTTPKSLALARANPGVHVTLIDWERILQVAHKVAIKLGIENQVISIPGDLFSLDFGSNQYDVAFMGDVTHFFSPRQNIDLFRKVYDALVIGGTLVVNAYRRDFPDPLAPGLWFYAVSAEGDVYDFQEYKDMLEQAGFINVIGTTTPPIKATKPL